MSWNPIRYILLVDDQKSVYEGLKNLAENKDLELYHCQTWEDAKGEIEKNFDKYHAIILDGKGQLDSDSVTDDAKHIHKALGWLREEKGKGNHIHYVLYTGYHEDFDALQDELPIYSKSDNKEEEMLDDIVKATENYVKIKYSDVYEVFESRTLPCSETKRDYQLLADKIIKSQFDNVSGICKSIRRIQESIYKHLMEMKVLKKECFRNNGMVNFKITNGYLSGYTPIEKDLKPKDKQGQNIDNLAKMIYWTSSANVHYKTEEERIYPVTKYGILSMFHALNEQLLWYKQVIDKS